MHVSLKHISKSYSGNRVLNRVCMTVDQGQIHALIGENGAGKSTLMKILLGVEQADSGDIVIDGENKRWQHPSKAREAGIAMVYQELSLIPSLTVVENVFLGRLLTGRTRLVNWAEMKRQAERIFHELLFPIDPGEMVDELSVAEKQMVEIARALAQNAELIILDEPTSPLTEQDANRLFSRIKILAEKGVSVVYITHRLEEVFHIAHHISILRDGELVRSCPINEVDMAAMVRDMVGRELAEQFPPRTKMRADVSKHIALKVDQATRKNEFYDISFSAREGEILGFAGLVGAGRTELVEAIFGVHKLDRGNIEIRKRAVKIHSPAQAVKSGIGLIPDDRKVKGLVPDAAVDFNLSMATGQKYATRWGWRLQNRERTAAKHLVANLRIKLSSLSRHVARLSGGNQQKVAIGKSLNSDSSILIFDEPTRGIDVAAKREIYHLLRKLADDGAAIILVSSELEEILGLSDRILVMCQGRLAGELASAEATQEKIMYMALGAGQSFENGTRL